MEFSLSTLLTSTRLLQRSIGIFFFTLILSLCSIESTVIVNVTTAGYKLGLEVPNAEIEGSPNKDGKGQSDWEYQAINFPDSIANSSKFLQGIDSYKRYKGDVKLVKKLGVDFIDYLLLGLEFFQGVDHYNKLINKLLKKGIKPSVTIFHFDMPQSLEEKYGGYLSHSFVNDLKDYSDFCFKTFGDRIKHWVTINEPKILSLFGYENGWAPPGRCSLPNMGCTRGGNSSTEPYIAAHNLILAHAAVYKLYKEKYQEEQGGEVGIALNINYYEPYDSKSLEDQAAAKRLLDFHLGWFVEPIVFGDYPKSMRELVKDRLPIFSEEQKVMLKGAYDFLGINYYLSSYAQNSPNSRVGVIPHHAVDALALELDSKIGVRLGYPETGGYPNGLRKLLEFIKEKYQDPIIYICENGVKENENSRPREESLNDLYRITFLLRHLNAVNKAIK
ncbi:hypothetical protein FEM48_Zijuj05G0053300 [Ziziphus jujuba var. spinosa]|uniref:Beta-glucosidase 24-like n=1 Tax=Ziziphus jujuba var. spinosa TaxID=714518 RepID=A0A978VD18_ZIZJJ|nr:hypothetical protein FEM48_Zijuj05G0053300 [Ziziphus jujuba var. spinosa]